MLEAKSPHRPVSSGAIGRRRPWWRAADGSRPSSPFFSLRLFGLENARLDVALSVAVLALVVVSRVAAFPASIWEQDEAYFAAAVIDFDPADNHPHPPWFLLWILLGKLVSALGAEPALGLQILSAVFGVWILYPLTALWSSLLRRESAVGASLLFLATPVAWVLAGRAFTGTAATALLVLALACWIRAPHERAWVVAGSLAAAASVLLRPHFAAPLVVAVVFAWVQLDRPLRRWLVAPAAAVLAAGGALLVAASGGWTPLWIGLQQHLSYHFERLPGATWSFAASGLARGLGHSVVAVTWVVLALIGFVALLRSRVRRDVTALVLGSLVPILITVYLLSDPTHARYAVPILALTGGPVVVGTAVILGRTSVAAIAVAMLSFALVVLPPMPGYRNIDSPPLRALEQAAAVARERGGVLVVDRTLVSFVEYLQASHRVAEPVVFDHYFELGASAPPPAASTVAVFDIGHDKLLLDAEERRSVSCEIPILRRLSQNRFIDLTVAEGAELANPSGVAGPLILPE
jgi:hypothetical protein